MKITRNSVAALGATAAIAFAAVPALAQDATAGESTTGDATTEAVGGDTSRDERMADHRAAFAGALAAELDLPVDQVTDAVTAVNERLRAEHGAERQAALEERLDDAVANGELTQGQADAMATAAEAGVLGGPNGQGHHDGSAGRGNVGPPTGAGPAADTDPS